MDHNNCFIVSHAHMQLDRGSLLMIGNSILLYFYLILILFICYNENSWIIIVIVVPYRRFELIFSV